MASFSHIGGTVKRSVSDLQFHECCAQLFSAKVLTPWAVTHPSPVAGRDPSCLFA